ncbi:30S ribosomal protein THX [Daejeonella oryzae]|nr:30S ribosomal protein THX [Daejeonella oryzae]
MGKGDIKTKRGKITNRSFGKLRLRNPNAKQEEATVTVKSSSKKKDASG